MYTLLVRLATPLMIRTRGAAVARAAGAPRGARSFTLSTDGRNIEDKIDRLDINQYNRVAGDYLETLADDLEALAEDFPQVDSELSLGVLTVTMPPNGTYVINKQPPNRQIWLSSPVSGPKRYDLIGGKWITLRDDTSLTALLEAEISTALGHEFKFDVDN